MKTKWYRIIGLGLTVLCLGLATQSPAKKPVKPPPEPEPGLPFTYQGIMILPDVQTSYFDTLSINNTGVVPGHYVDVQYGTSGFVAYPVIVNSTNVTYPDSSVELIPGGAEAYWINNLNQKAGQRYVSGIRKAKLWLEDNTEIDLGIATEGMESHSCAINDAGMIVVRTWEPEGVFSGLVWPVDTNSDGAAETWFADVDGDGINDLYLPLDDEGYAPIAINASGQILFDLCLLTPDFSDADGDGNPWYADEDADSANDLLDFLCPLPDYAETYTEAYDINDLGQIVGTSNGRAVKWDDPAVPVDLGQPTKHSESLEAWLINNEGQIIGHCKDKARTSITFLIHNGERYDLNEMIPGETHVHPATLNDSGWIVDNNGVVYVAYPQP